MDEPDRRLLRRYYRRSADEIRNAVLVVAAAAGLLLAGGVALRIASVGLVGAYVAFRTLRRAPEDQQVDGWMRQDLLQVRRLALQKLDLDESDIVQRDRLVIVSPLVMKNTYGIPDDDIRWRRGKDALVRFSVYSITEILLTEHHLGVYRCDFNSLRGAFLNERAEEFHYRHVVSVALEEHATNYTLANGSKMVRAEEFRLRVTNGETIQAVVSSPDIVGMVGGRPKATNIEKTVRVIRKQLRDRSA